MQAESGVKPRATVEMVVYPEKDVLPFLYDIIYSSSRRFRRDRFAIFAEHELAQSLIRSGFEAEFLSPRINYHWSGIQRRAQEKKWKRVVIGDYSDWFAWYMKWHRFRAFHVVILIKPIQYLSDCNFRGYIDGLLARLRSNPLSKLVLVEEERFKPFTEAWSEGSSVGPSNSPLELGEQELRQALLALLYGTRLTRTELQTLATATLWNTVNDAYRALPNALGRLRAFIDRSFDGYYRLSEHGMRFVQALERVNKTEEVDGEPQFDELFRPTRRRRPLNLPGNWVEEQINAILKEKEWVTVPILQRLLSERIEELSKDWDRGLIEVLEEYPDLTLEEEQRILEPTRRSIRRILERLTERSEVEKHHWYREIGRPANVYCQLGRLPFMADTACGQCAFYISQRHRCRLWWLLNKSFNAANPRWQKEGEHPLSLFELHKMKNAWRIGPRSSACLRFLDKKRDYKRKSIPDNCDICGEGMSPEEVERPFRRCMNCATRYFRMRTGVKVLTSYEHEFRKNYREIAGHEPGPDIERLEEEDSDSLYRKLEREEYEAHRTQPGTPEDSYSRTLVLFPTDTMFVRDGKLFILKRRKVEALPMSGTMIVDHIGISKEQREALERGGATVKDVPEREAAPRRDALPLYRVLYVVERLALENSPIVRKFAVAMVKSGVVATQRIVALANVKGSETDALQREQLGLLRRLEHTERPKYLVYEALVMRRYWKCYDIALRRVLARIGPRTKSRFVTDYVPNPAGRARGYSAVDAAINYLHQRRLYKSRLANSKLGLGWDSGEGFLHRKRKNVKGIGLLLDLADPFKFADREKLLEVILKFELNWRDFYIAADRQGVKFYYPRPQAVDILELVGIDADNMEVHYDSKVVTLHEAYGSATSKLIHALNSETPQPYEPFIFGSESDFSVLT